MLARHPRFVLVGDPAAGRPLGLITRMQLLRHLHGRLDGFEERIDRRAEQQRRAPGADRPAAGRAPAGVARRARRDDRRGLPARPASPCIWWAASCATCCWGGRTATSTWWSRATASTSPPGSPRRSAAGCAPTPPSSPRWWSTREGFHIDVATARSEFYRAPAALPEVQTSALRQDLFRRDFTINTLAIRLGPDPAPELIDLLRRPARPQGEDRCACCTACSFIDDPTRILRGRAPGAAPRLPASPRRPCSSSRWRSPRGSSITSPARACGTSWPCCSTIRPSPCAVSSGSPSWASCARSIRAGAGRGGPRAAARRAGRPDWYRLRGDRRSAGRALASAPVALAGRPRAAADRERLADRLLLDGEDRRLLTGFPDRLAAARAVLEGRSAAPHRAAEALEPLAGEELLLLMAEGRRRRAAPGCAAYLTELRRLKLALRGADLLAAGVPARAPDRRGPARHAAGPPRRPYRRETGGAALRSRCPAGKRRLGRRHLCALLCTHAPAARRPAGPGGSTARRDPPLRLRDRDGPARGDPVLPTAPSACGTGRSATSGWGSPSWGRTSCRAFLNRLAGEDLSEAREPPRRGSRAPGSSSASCASSFPGRRPDLPLRPLRSPAAQPVAGRPHRRGAEREGPGHQGERRDPGRLRAPAGRRAQRIGDGALLPHHGLHRRQARGSSCRGSTSR